MEREEKGVRIEGTRREGSERRREWGEKLVRSGERRE
jgi:hypothetical protein